MLLDKPAQVPNSTPVLGGGRCNRHGRGLSTVPLTKIVHVLRANQCPQPAGQVSAACREDQREDSKEPSHASAVKECM